LFSVENIAADGREKRAATTVRGEAYTDHGANTFPRGAARASMPAMLHCKFADDGWWLAILSGYGASAGSVRQGHGGQATQTGPAQEYRKWP